MSSRHRQSTARPTSNRPSGSLVTSSRRNQQITGDLPPYRKPSHPLNERAQARLREIYGNRGPDTLKRHQTEAAKLLTLTAGSINDNLREREEYVARRRRKWERGERTEEQDALEGELKELRQDVEKCTSRLEESMRNIIDHGEAAQRISDSLNWVRENGPRQIQAEYNTQMTQRESQTGSLRPRRTKTQSEEDEDEDEGNERPTPGPTPLTQARVTLTGPSEMFKQRMDMKKNEYFALSHHIRYAQNNDYIGFKRIVHDANYGDEGPPLPHAESWFTESGAPAPGVTSTQANADDDDDIVVDRATISTRCPLTFQQFKEPVTSRKCPHTFEKHAIQDFIRRSNVRVAGGEKAFQCPVPGCDQMISMSDLFEDVILIRKIRRMQAAESRNAEDSDEENGGAHGAHESDDDDDNQYTSLPPRSQSKSQSVVPVSRAPPRSSAVVDLGDPSDDDEDSDE
ncbi:zinc-finger of the MIZ type in Nse subunit-domain-containing protein [Dendryphion nanum]|uniref:Zinc-finger of the MIZ type in Nse subunit-domain-containing protein n=1 Tax=Dendryphion nanum TaxID=256645 RepID=A0A9P9IGA8_9PLEO|nr:zinc-finger of the MIZ type in Nse subunit-domain-containing protein [Dendryphion nanum]